MNHRYSLSVLPFLILGCSSGGSESSPLQATDALLQALVNGNARQVSKMVLTPSQLKSIMECGSEPEFFERIETMLTEQKDRLAYLSKGPRPSGFLGEITEFEIDKREIEKAGSVEGPCVLMKNLEDVTVDFRYALATSTEDLSGARGNRDRVEFIKHGSRYLIVEAPEMEEFEALAKNAGSEAPSGGGSRLAACRAEVPSNVKAIKMAEEIYNSEMDAYLEVRPHPSQRAPGREAQRWGTSNTGFNNLNWMPDGNVRGVYSVSTTWPSSSKTCHKG